VLVRAAEVSALWLQVSVVVRICAWPSTSEAAALVQVSEGVHPDPDTAHPHRELLPSFGATAEAVETPPPWWDDPVHGGPLQDGQRREGR
jgi:hypothetical protein